MSKEFLKYYNRELSYLRHKGREFGSQYPKIASRLRLNEEQVEDPHVERVMEGCAFLTAKIRQSLDNGFPELTEALIGQLFPDFHAPIPSVSIIKMECSDTLSSGILIDKGHEVLVNAPGYNECIYQTCYNTNLLPIDIIDAKFENTPFLGVGSNSIENGANSVIKLNIVSSLESISIGDLNFDSLRFYLNGNQQVSLKLYQLIFKSCIGLSIIQNKKVIKNLTPRNISKVGYLDEDKIVPYSKKSFSPARLLTEYIHMPEKFLFFDLNNISCDFFENNNEFEVWIYFDSKNNWLSKQVTKDSIMLGCTPIINMYKASIEPINIRASEYEYKLTPKHLDADTTEIINIQNVSMSSWNKNYNNIPSFYSGKHNYYRSSDEIYWSIRREDRNWAGGFDEPGREVYLSLINKNHKVIENNIDDNWIVAIEAMCCNRNLPQKIPFGGGLPVISLPNLKDNFQNIRCLMAPTSTIRPEMGAETRWQFSKHLTLINFDNKDGIETLKQFLSLYSFKGNIEIKSTIDSLESMSIQSSTGRVNQKGKVGFAHGSNITLEISDQILSEEQIFFLGTVLSYFFSQLSEINTFTKLIIKLKSTGMIFHQFDAVVGDRPLL